MADFFTHFSCVLDVGTPDNAARALKLYQAFMEDAAHEEVPPDGFLLSIEPEHGATKLWISRRRHWRSPAGNTRRLEMAIAAEISIKRTIRRQQLREMVPLADSTIYEMEQRGEFPRRFALSPRCVVWDLAEVEAWLASRRSAPDRPRAISRRQATAIAPGSSAGSGSSSGIEGGMSTGTRFLPATQASMMSDHSCIMWRRCTSYSALL